MRKKGKDNASEESCQLASEIYDLLNSYGFLEQLRLECIADVKKKETYQQLKDRIKDYVTNKMSKEDWTSGALHLDTFREQVVECGVLTLTVERIVDVVVSRKLLEEVKPLITDIVYKYANQLRGKNKSPERLQKNTPRKSDKKSLQQTAELVRKICEDTQQGSKKIFEDGFISSSLASVSFSKSHGSDDEFSLSVSSVNTSDLSSDTDVSSDEEYARGASKRSTKVGKGHADRNRRLNSVPQVQEETGRERRERKLNPKYSSSLYHTDIPSFDHVPSSVPAITQENEMDLTSSSKREVKCSTPVKKDLKSLAPRKEKLHTPDRKEKKRSSTPDRRERRRSCTPDKKERRRSRTPTKKERKGLSTPDKRERRRSSTPEKRKKRRRSLTPDIWERKKSSSSKKLLVPKTVSHKDHMSSSASTTSNEKDVTEEYIVTNQLTRTSNMKIKILKKHTKSKHALHCSNDLNSKKRKDAYDDTRDVLRVTKKAVVEKKTIENSINSGSVKPETTESFGENSMNGCVRKSGRQRKLNTKFFDDYAHTGQSFSSFHSENSCLMESSEDIETHKSSREGKLPRPDDYQSNYKPKTTIKELSDEVQIVSEISPSKKRYDSSELYKPRPVIQSSGNRFKRTQSIN